MQCPLMFRLRTVDRLPEPGSLATHKGTVVHGVLERLYDLPASERLPQAALELLPGQWASHREKNPEVMDLFEDADQVETWLEEARGLIRTYFTLENPQRLEPAERELFVQTETGDGLLLRGFVDRLDVAPDGAMRVVDYKTGRSPARVSWRRRCSRCASTRSCCGVCAAGRQPASSWSTSRTGGS